jgi:hypothetical protein
VRYFTPELLARCRSAADDEAQAAADGWEQALAAYSARLQKLRPLLPLGARQLLRRTSLHDARCLLVSTSGSGPRKDLSLTLRLAGSPPQSARGVEVRYRLCGRSTLRCGTDPLSAGSFTRRVLYDEFDLHQRRGAKTFTHSLLLTGGLELRVRFSNLQLHWLSSVQLASRPTDIEKDRATDGVDPGVGSGGGRHPRGR